MIVVAFDIDGTLIDTRPSFTRIVKELSLASDDDIQRFRDTGNFNDDWELARALCCWIAAGRPRIVERLQGVADAVLWCSHDPGDLSARATALYRGGYHHDEVAVVEGTLLRQLEDQALVVACTGRDDWEYQAATRRLGHRFTAATTMEQAKKPDPRALLRLLPAGAEPIERVVLLGDTHADRRTVAACRQRRPDLDFAFIFVDSLDSVGGPASRRFLHDALASGVAAAIERHRER